MIILKHRGIESIVTFGIYDNQFSAVITDSIGQIHERVDANTIESLDSIFCEEVDWFLEEGINEE